MSRYVIVAQLSIEAHTPTVYGTWATEDAARKQMERWEQRIERTFDGDPGTGIVMSVEPVSRTSAQFAADFAERTGQKLAR